MKYFRNLLSLPKVLKKYFNIKKKLHVYIKNDKGCIVIKTITDSMLWLARATNGKFIIFSFISFSTTIAYWWMCISALYRKVSHIVHKTYRHHHYCFIQKLFFFLHKIMDDVNGEDKQSTLPVTYSRRESKKKSSWTVSGKEFI